MGKICEPLIIRALTGKNNFSFYSPFSYANSEGMKAPIDSPIMGEFVDNLDQINTLAEAQAGFIWRFKDECNNATAIRLFDADILIVNMSVW